MASYRTDERSYSGLHVQRASDMGVATMLEQISANRNGGALLSMVYDQRMYFDSSVCAVFFTNILNNAAPEQ